MKQVIIAVEEDLYRFYQKIGKAAGGRSAETVMGDALFQLAGQLSSQMIGNPEKPEQQSGKWKCTL